MGVRGRASCERPSESACSRMTGTDSRTESLKQKCTCGAGAGGYEGSKIANLAGWSGSEVAVHTSKQPPKRCAAASRSVG